MGTKSMEISDDAHLTLERLARPRESFSDVIVRLGLSNHRRTLIRRICVVLWGYSLAVWLYVLAYQLRYRDGIYDVLTWWLPIRMDYLAEAAFALSFLFALIAVSYRAAER